MFFLDFRETIVERYPEIYRATVTEGQESGSGFGEKWGWDQHIFKLAGFDPFRVEDATGLNVNFAHYFLAFLKDHDDEMIRNIKLK